MAEKADIERREIEEIDDVSSNFSKYLRYIESMKYSTKNDLHKCFKDTDFIPVDLLSEALPPEILQMESLYRYRAITRSFYNGLMKQFCIDPVSYTHLTLPTILLV